MPYLSILSVVAIAASLVYYPTMNPISLFNDATELEVMVVVFGLPFGRSSGNDNGDGNCYSSLPNSCHCFRLGHYESSKRFQHYVHGGKFLTLYSNRILD